MENQEVKNEVPHGDDRYAVSNGHDDPNSNLGVEPNGMTASEVNRGEDRDGSNRGDEHPTKDAAEHDSPDMFPRKVVEDLRKEAAKYRERAKRTDTLEQQLHLALVKLDGRLADPADLPFHAEHLEDPEQLSAAITALVEKNPRMKAMRPIGDAGQGNRGGAKPAEFDLIKAIRGY
ncbi:hypothetical protein [Corynebacterium epidermidicanis]|nr:hypothetical protein [Corynebacterium epidermidicanis]